MKPALFVAFVACAGVAGAQRADTSRANPLDPVVITAERAATKLSATASSVSRVEAGQLRHTPNTGFADFLRLVPGFALVDFDGLGRDPALMLRGFYGGGEAEYVVVLVDGEPVNQLHTGLVPWETMPNADAIHAIEVLRGGASPLYGDAALAGVINIVTRRDGSSHAGWSLSSGTYNTWRLGADASGTLGTRSASASLALNHGDGFRRHSERTAAHARASIRILSTSAHRLALGIAAYARDFDEPGPLLDSVAARDRRESDPLFRFDHTKDRNVALSLNGDHRIATRARLSTSAAAELRDLDATRTAALAPGFGDTRERSAETMRGRIGAQLEVGSALVGVELSRGALDSRYYEVFTGARPAYVRASGARGDLSASGEAARTTAALFGHVALPLNDLLRLSLGVRADWLRDGFDPRVPAAAHVTTTHAAISPKAALNMRYAAAGHAYMAVNRSFKAPTLDQLFDQRPYPVPFPPFSVTTSNATLGPQYGTTLEAGFTQGVGTVGRSTLSLSGSVYHMAMRDELDFDVTTLRYVNIGRSRHRGVELGVNAQGGAWSTFGNYALQSVTAQSGDASGKYLKAIPRHALTAGLTVSPARRFDLSVVALHAHTIYLDDANSRTLPNYTRIDVQVARRLFGGADIVFMLRNALDSHYNSTGFPDPSASGAVYYLPAAGRTVSLGFRSAR